MNLNSDCLFQFINKARRKPTSNCFASASLTEGNIRVFDLNLGFKIEVGPSNLSFKSSVKHRIFKKTGSSCTFKEKPVDIRAAISKVCQLHLDTLIMVEDYHTDWLPLRVKFGMSFQPQSVFIDMEVPKGQPLHLVEIRTIQNFPMVLQTQTSRSK